MSSNHFIITRFSFCRKFGSGISKTRRKTLNFSNGLFFIESICTYLAAMLLADWINYIDDVAAQINAIKTVYSTKTLVFVWPLNSQCSYAVILHNDYICIKMQHKKVQQIVWKSICFTIKLRWKVKNLVISRLFAAHIYSEQRWKKTTTN